MRRKKSTKKRNNNKRPQIPVTVLTGFLGSGKTTLLNHILSSNEHKMRFAIIENELGDISIDDKVLVAQKETQEGEEIIEVMNGCICCTVRGDLVQTLHRLYAKVHNFDGLIIETTGLADPAPVVQTFFVDHHLMMMYRLDAVITVVDAFHIRERLAFVPPQEKKDEGVINESVAQLAFADKIILNKMDLVEKEEDKKDIEKQIRSINSTAPILPSEHSVIHPKELLNIGAFSLNRVLDDINPDFLDDIHETKHDSAIGSVALTYEGELNNTMLQTWIRQLINNSGGGHEQQQDQAMEEEEEGHEGHDHDKAQDPNAMQLYRYKGIFAIKGFDRKLVLQGVGMMFRCNFSQKVWSSDEKRMNTMILIGRNLPPKSQLQVAFESCKVDPNIPLRFEVGNDRVLAFTDHGWERGSILKHWDEGHAYRIRILERDMELWAPVDTDDYIRPMP